MNYRVINRAFSSIIIGLMPLTALTETNSDCEVLAGVAAHDTIISEATLQSPPAKACPRIAWFAV